MDPALAELDKRADVYTDYTSNEDDSEAMGMELGWSASEAFFLVWTR